MSDRLDGPERRYLLLEYFFDQTLTHDSIQAENIDEDLKIEISGEVAQPVFLLQLVGDQDGA